MNRRIVVSGTDTGIGKTVFAAGLTALLDAVYWKPIQAGLEEETDCETVVRLTGLPKDRVIPEAWRLRTPASPHLAAALDGNPIDPDALVPPTTERLLVIEGAGGLLVPLTDSTLLVDVFARWRAPVVLCARTGLGTINHTLLSIEALLGRSIPVLGIAFIGAEHEENRRIISQLSGIPILGRLPYLNPLNADTLGVEFRRAFSAECFLQGGVPA